MMQKNTAYMHSKAKENLTRYSLLVLSFFLGAISSLIITKSWLKMPYKMREIRQGGYKFINPLLECEMTSGQYFRELKNFKYKIEELADSKIQGGMAIHISVYFRDLNNGPWFGINENEDFTPASLLKIPIMISWLKKAEFEPRLLKKVIKYEGAIDDMLQDIPPRKAIKIGESYTVEELIHRMLAYSDNEAKNLLLMNIDADSLNRTYRDLGLDIPNIRKPEDFMSVKSYASFFRILYNASYLNKQMSELALKILSKVDFKEGLVAGVPQGTQVAHKFGERIFNETKQMHDCGIFYYKNYPYLLCVMTRGKDLKQLSGIIKDISHLVYSEVQNQCCQ